MLCVPRLIVAGGGGLATLKLRGEITDLGFENTLSGVWHKVENKFRVNGSRVTRHTKQGQTTTKFRSIRLRSNFCSSRTEHLK